MPVGKPFPLAAIFGDLLNRTCEILIMRTLLLLIFITKAFGTQAQSWIYHPFPDSNAVWNWHYYTYYCTPWTPIDEEYSYTLDGDTVIGSMQYHKIITPFVHVNNTLCGVSNNVGYKGCIRQSIIDKKVYCILPNDTIEHLIFDFNIQVGDSIPTIPYPCYSKIFVSQIDSVLIGTTYRKRWVGSGLVIIEGIGANWEFLNPMCEIIDRVTGMLTCFRQNGTTIYPDSLNNCSLITNINSISNTYSLVKLFPNPFHLSMTVVLSVEKATMEIYNSFGEFVRVVRISDYSAVINRNSLTDGIYFYRLSNDKGEITSGKFIIE